MAKRYKTDNFGKRQYVWTESEEIQPLLNTEWDPACKYVARKDRAEWLPVGLIGQMLVRDDALAKRMDIVVQMTMALLQKPKVDFCYKAYG